VTGGTVNGNISSDPKFVNYTGTALGNYKLQAASPVIDSGTTLNAPSIDLGGGRRPGRQRYDIGCYEYGAALGLGAVLMLRICSRLSSLLALVYAEGVSRVSPE